VFVCVIMCVSQPLCLLAAVWTNGTQEQKKNGRLQ